MTMAETTTWIKLDRNITRWGWYGDNNTKAVFIHLLLRANIEDHYFMGVLIRRGEFATSWANLASELNMSVKSVRVAVKHLESTGEVASKGQGKFTVFSVVSYDRYQSQGQAKGNKRASEGQAKGNNQRSIRSKERKNNARVREDDRAWETELDVPEQFRGRFGSKEDWLKWWEGGDPDEV